MRVLLPSSLTDQIRLAGARWGQVSVRLDSGEGVVVVFSLAVPNRRVYTASTWAPTHYTSAHGTLSGVGVWYTVNPKLHEIGLDRRMRGAALDTEKEFRPLVKAGWTFPPHDGFFVLTVARQNNKENWFAWQVDKQTASLLSLEHIDENLELLSSLGDGWPSSYLAEKRILVVGAGSIGGATCEALASYAIKRLTILDPDRLETRNFARHRANRREIGRYKAAVIADLLEERDDTVEVQPGAVDVVRETDIVRPLVSCSDVVVVSVDGVTPRRVMNHLAVHAGVPVIFSAVLESGAIGEIIRVLPGRTGCLLCHRDTLFELGHLDPEPELDDYYPIAGGARPMTAVGGDLSLIGELSAKVAVSTLLESSGDRSATLAGDHLAIALRPTPGLAEPFNLERNLEFRWTDLPKPRPDCPTCSTA